MAMTTRRQMQLTDPAKTEAGTGGESLQKTKLLTCSGQTMLLKALRMFFLLQLAVLGHGLRGTAAFRRTVSRQTSRLSSTLSSGDVFVLREREILVVEGRKCYRLELRPNAEIERNGEIALVFAEDESSLSVDSLQLSECRVITDITLTQRQIEDRVINPHSEHSEDVWLVLARQLPISLAPP